MPRRLWKGRPKLSAAGIEALAAAAADLERALANRRAILEARTQERRAA